MKTVHIKNAILQQVMIAPNQPIRISYTLLDDKNTVLYHKTAEIPRESLPSGIVDNFLAKLLAKVVSDEGL